MLAYKETEMPCIAGDLKRELPAEEITHKDTEGPHRANGEDESGLVRLHNCFNHSKPVLPQSTLLHCHHLPSLFTSIRAHCTGDSFKEPIAITK